MTERPAVAVFRPDDERLASAVELLEALGASPVADPMLAVDPTGAVPPTDADVTVFTSRTGARLVAEEGWTPGDTRVVAIGDATADALAAAGYAVDLVPGEFSSAGLVAALDGTVDDARVVVARSDHGSDVLLDGLADAGARVEEIVLYRLTRPAGSGASADAAAAGDLAAALFTSSLTVEHFLDAASDRGVAKEAREALDTEVLVGAIGEPTAETLADHGITVDVVPDRADFDALARAAVDTLT